MYDILLLNPTIIPKTKNEKIKATLSYVDKTLSTYSTIDYKGYNEEELIGRITAKIRKLYED
jgi:hypothetical protein